MTPAKVEFSWSVCGVDYAAGSRTDEGKAESLLIDVGSYYFWWKGLITSLLDSASPKWKRSVSTSDSVPVLCCGSVSKGQLIAVWMQQNYDETNYRSVVWLFGKFCIFLDSLVWYRDGTDLIQYRYQIWRNLFIGCQTDSTDPHHQFWLLLFFNKKSQMLGLLQLCVTLRIIVLIIMIRSKHTYTNQHQ